MIQIINYTQSENIVSAGFKKYSFAVYGKIGVIDGFTKQQYLQKLYEQCKHAIDYETERYNQGKSNSIVTDEEGEEFIPELPKLVYLKLLIDTGAIQFQEGEENVTVKLDAIIKDQYGEDINLNIIYATDIGSIEDDILIIPNTEEPTEIVVTATVGDMSDEITICVYPYKEPEPRELDLLREEDEKMKIKMHSLEQTSSEVSQTQQELIELLLEMEVI